MHVLEKMLDECSEDRVKMRLAIQALLEWESWGNHIDKDILDQLKEAIA